MKKNIIFCIAAVLPMLLSCEKDNLTESGKATGIDESDLIFTARFAQNDNTRTSLELDGKTIKWAEGDAIKILPVKNKWQYTGISASMVSISADKKTATFAAEKKPQPYTPAFGVYPASLGTGLCSEQEGLNSFIFNVPQEQDGSFASANILAAKCNGTHLDFKNVCGIFKLRFSNKEGATLIVTGSGIADKMKVTFTDGQPASTTVAKGADKITVSGVECNTDYYIGVAPGTYSDLILLVQDTNGSEIVQVKYPKALKVTPGLLVNWADLSDHATAYIPEKLKEKLLALCTSETQFKKISFVVSSADPKKDGEIVIDESGVPVYASMDLQSGFVTIRTSAPEFKGKSGSVGLKDCFKGMTNLCEIVGFEKINTSEVTNASGMFKGCTSLKTIDFSKFDTSNVTDMSEMFSYCELLESLSLNKFDTRKVRDFTQMLCGCNRISILNMRGENFVIRADANLTRILGKGDNSYMGNMNGIPYATISISTANLERLTAAMGDAMNCYAFQLPAYMPTGTVFQGLIGNLSREKGIYPTTIKFMTYKAGPTSGAVRVNAGYAGMPVYMSMDGDGKVEIWTPGNSFILNEDCTSMFHSTPTVGDEGARCHKVTTIIGMDNWDTSKVTTMETMFYGCESLVSYNFGSFYTANVTSMSGMFANCYKMPSFNVSSWDTSKVTTMYRMFYNCTSLTSLELNTFDTSNVTTMSAMFAGCTMLQSVNILKFDTSKVTTMKSMFYDCINLAGINIGSKFTFEGKNTGYMFSGLGTNNSKPYCTFSCYDWQKTAIQGILGSDAAGYAFSIKPAL